MLTALKTKKVEAIPGLNVIQLPLYVPTDVVNTLPGLSNFSFVEELESVVDAEYTSELGDTLFHSLRETNATPSPSQAQALRSIRASCEADRESLNAEIQRLYSKIFELSLALIEIAIKQVQRQNLSSSCSSLLSPIRLLPSEILEEIFIRCLPSHGRPVATEAPLLLTHVCSVWRRTALGFPLLWKHLFLRTTPTRNQAITPLETSHIIDLWFERASDSPLTFHLYHTYYTDRQHDGNVVNSMLKHARHFQKLHLSCSSVNNIYGFLTHTPGHLERLESLQLEIGDLYEPNPMITVFDKAPLLHEVILNVATKDRVSYLNLPWKQLTTISITATAIYQVNMLYLLRECEQLVSGSFKIATGWGDEEIANVFGTIPVVLEYLIDLRVSLSPSSDIEDHPFNAFDRLSLPALTHFALVGDYQEYPHLSYIHLLGVFGSAPRLQHLTLLNCHTTSNDLLPILQNSPRLTFLKLSLDSDAKYNYLIEALAFLDGQVEVYVPLLESLDMRVNSVYGGLAVSELVEMIRARRITSVEATLPPVAYLNVHLRLRDGLSSELGILRNAQVKGEIELSTYDGHDDEDDNRSISFDIQ